MERNQAETEEMYAREEREFWLAKFNTHEEKPMNETNVATMTAKELEQHIQAIEQRHRSLLKSLRALLRVRQEEEAQ